MSRRTGELEFIDINPMGNSRVMVGSSGSRTVGKSRSASTVRRKRKKARVHSFLMGLLLVCILIVTAAVLGRRGIGRLREFIGNTFFSERSEFLSMSKDDDEYPQELIELLEKNEETLDFVRSYPKREEYKSQTIDLSEEYQSGEVPLLMQWDRRWGYDSYGEEMIGLAGCDSTCLDMMYLYFTGDTAMNPRKMAEFAYDNGYYTTEGTSWSLWTEGVEKLGLTGEQLPLDEVVMKGVLDNGGLIVCSMAPGDFTTTGHFIVLRGYDESGFYVNDPNRRSTSEKQWDFETLQGQIKNLWGIYG